MGSAASLEAFGVRGRNGKEDVQRQPAERRKTHLGTKEDVHPVRTERQLATKGDEKEGFRTKKPSPSSSEKKRNHPEKGNSHSHRQAQAEKKKAKEKRRVSGGRGEEIPECSNKGGKKKGLFFKKREEILFRTT